MLRIRQTLTGLKGLLGGLAGIGGAATLGALIRNINEAEKATAQLDAAFANTGKTAGVTRSRLDDLAAEIQRTTTVSDDLVKEAESILLTFDKVRGQAFERTVRVAADLSARLGTDLKGAIRQVGLALQDPERGLIGLRRAGVAFTESQRNLIKSFIETNQSAKAQELILGELERRFEGSAAAARNTLGGALAGLKNAFGDLFEGTRASTSGLVDSINSISTALSDPDVKKGIDTLVAGLSKVVELLIRAAAGVGTLQARVIEFATKRDAQGAFTRGLLSQIPIIGPLAGLAAGAGAAGGSDGRTRGPSGAARQSSGLGGSSGAASAAIAPLEEINITVRRIVDEHGDLMRELADSTKTSVERTAAEYIKLKTTLQLLRDEGVITQEKFQERIGGALDELLPEFDLNAIRAKYKVVKKETTELGEFMKGVWQGVGQSIQATLSDAIYEWRISWRSILDIVRRALADILSAIITSGIKKALQEQASSSSTSSSSSGGGFLNFIGSLFGLAGGGRFDGLRMVGEAGPELVSGSGRVFNQRQMAFAGAGGASITYAPEFNLNIQTSGDEESERRVIDYVETRIAQSQGEFVRLLSRNDVEVKG